MQFPKRQSHEGLVEIRHQIPGRTRLRVPILSRVPNLEGPVAAALATVDGVHRVRLNSACASLVLHHCPDFTPTHDHLKRTLKPILAPTASIGQPIPKAPQRPEKARTRSSVRTQRTTGSLSAACPICQLKLRATRWILNDVWRCWRDHWTQRLRGCLVASLALFRP